MNYADFQFLKFETKPNGVLLITINRPEVMNATNPRLHWMMVDQAGRVRQYKRLPAGIALRIGLNNPQSLCRVPGDAPGRE